MKTQPAVLFVLIGLLTVSSLASTSVEVRRWNLLESGGVGDGKTDCTATLQGLLTQAGKTGGGVVEVPAGTFRINGNLSVPANVTLRGVFRTAPNPTISANGEPAGSVLAAYAGRGETNGAHFIRLAGNNAAVEGLIVTYPEWKQTDVPPVPYPPCIQSEDTLNVAVQECCLLNPYEGIRFTRAARYLVRNVTGYPIKRGLFVDECYDIGHIENIHFWPFGVNYDPNNAYCRWVNMHGVAFELARTDWHYVHNTFCFGYGVGYKFSKSRHGSTNGNFLGLGADSCEQAVVVEQAQPPGLLISNGEFVGRWTSTEAVCVEIMPEVQGKVSLVNCSFWGPIDRCVWMRAPEGQFTASACHFVEWDNRGTGSPAIQADAGKVIVQGSTFQRPKVSVAIGSNVVSAILTGNQAEGGFRIRNNAGKRTQSALNEEEASVEWTKEARLNYVFEIGLPGDASFLESWQGHEYGHRPFRWSGPVSLLRLPVVPGVGYMLTFEFTAPKQAISSEAGLYRDGRRIATIEETPSLKVDLTPSTTNMVELELRCQGWVPMNFIAGSGDNRTLGISGHKIRMQAAGAGAKVFDANKGIWMP